ncbi:two-component sensor histidine kinase [cyanobacterium endosymbiont of Rhopalodia gibberula]|uniref:GAF domain-containing sensor histidine kinase n=1 Tax=cyanobacterium endosymbiont of Rhopalodia gibberula TaxID=1763363 RepID=UPI000DC70DDD|nr:GAF domain-containing sensor histidine kinase [cyanobacterium endosymbiont of Rhopalodia gibberula]BBA79156.1 two-component sensor histidine kinase [cyanobacterium endosymbiont of Rhopalodia gibberula]
MSSAAYTFITPSKEFITLCRAQTTLLTQGLKADWSGIYLTQEREKETHTSLIPLLFSPQKCEFYVSKNVNLSLPKVEKFLNSSISLPIANSFKLSKSLKTNFEGNHKIIDENKTTMSNPHQLVLPLMYKDIVVGLLVTRRKNRPWQQSELEQIETIAQTLAIARLLDSHQQWYQEQLSQQQTLQKQEHERLDDLFHQLRNPLTALQIFGKLLLKRLHSDEKSTAIVESIVRESDHLQELLQEFEVDKQSLKDDVVTLDARSTRSLPSEQFLSLSAIQVTEILEPLLTSAKSIAQEKSIELKIDILEDLPCIWGDPQALREVFSNIINNAFKYTPSGGQVFVQVGLLSMTNGQSYQGVVIEDTGCGIPIEDQEHIFERHYRGVQEKGEIPGSGLGLAIAKDLVTQMQGLIELVSPTDEMQNMGTKFLVWLPLVDSLQ